MAEKEKNIIFVGDGEAPKSIHGVKKFLDLPDPKLQAEGFYYERASELTRAFPRLYKRFVKKGEK